MDASSISSIDVGGGPDVGLDPGLLGPAEQLGGG